MKPHRITYIAGPMRGLPDNNYPAFLVAAQRLRALGHEVVSPVEINHGADDDGSKPPETYLQRDLRELVECNCIALLSGWDKSVGARCEVAIAISLGFAFYDAGSGMRIRTPRDVLITHGYHGYDDAEAPAELRARLAAQHSGAALTERLRESKAGAP